MRTKRNGKDDPCKSSEPVIEPKPPKPIQAEIVVQAPPEPSKQVDTVAEASSTEAKNFHRFTHDDGPYQSPLDIVEELLYHTLQELQSMYNAACKAKTGKITIELPNFEKIATKLQDAWEQAKTAQRTREDSKVLSALRQIQASIGGLDQKYEDIQSKVTEAPKTYAEIIKSTAASTSINAKEKAVIEMRAQRRQQRETLR